MTNVNKDQDKIELAKNFFINNDFLLTVGYSYKNSKVAEASDMHDRYVFNFKNIQNIQSS